MGEKDPSHPTLRIMCYGPNSSSRVLASDWRVGTRGKHGVLTAAEI